MLMIKVTLVGVLFMLVISHDAKAQTFVETQVRVSDSRRVLGADGRGEQHFRHDLTFDGILTRPVNEKVGVFLWGMVTDGWSQSYGGLAYGPSKWLSISFGVGLEQANNLWRTGTSVFVSRGEVESLSIYEIGAGGWWYKSVTSFQASPNVRLGLFSQRHIGTGPYLERKVRDNLSVWTTVGRSDRLLVSLSGFRVSF